MSGARKSPTTPRAARARTSRTPPGAGARPARPAGRRPRGVTTDDLRHQPVDDAGEETRDGQRRRPRLGDREPVEHRERRLQGEHRQHRRRAGPHPLDPGGGPVARAHRERLRVPVPAGQRVAHPSCADRADVHVRRRARPPVEVLVAAADGEVDAAAASSDRHDARRCGTGPTARARPPACAAAVSPRQVEQLTGAVVDVRQRDQGDLVAPRRARTPGTSRGRARSRPRTRRPRRPHRARAGRSGRTPGR